MKTVTEVSRITGVSVRALHHYDAIGLLKPTAITNAGYRLYDDAALEKLYLILVFRELGLPLRQIGAILDAPDFDRNQALEDQVQSMQDKITQLKNRITLAKGIQTLGVKYMDFNGFDPKTLDDYSAQAKALYGKTEAYQEYTHKAKGRSKQQEQVLGGEVMAFFTRLGQLRGEAPDSDVCRSWAKELQDFFTAHFYTCTPQILRALAESYAGGGTMTENIDKAGGDGTGAFAKLVIDSYLDSL